MGATMSGRDQRERTEAAPVIRLDTTSTIPKYQQIVLQVEAHVASGRLRAGAPLPSVRQLSGDLGINVNTVLAAYRALEAEEIVLLRHGSRAMIHPRLAQPPHPGAADYARARAALERTRTEALLAGVGLEVLRALALDVFAESAATNEGRPVGEEREDS
ncbi:MAG TPA: GntR family transcriptional regulator [Ktedonobacterales bacterium]|nr:GntR family transcriptional regulator [Ktedonobacterales bacterium]